MVYRVEVLSAILLTGVACTIPLCAAGQKAQPPTTPPTSKAQLPKITQKVTFQGSCTANVVESDGVQQVSQSPGSASVDPRQLQAAYAKAKAMGMTLGEGWFLWKTQPLSCDSVQIIELDDYKTHTVIEFLDGSKKPVLAFEGPLALQQPGSTYVIATNILLPDGKVSSLQPAIQGPHCEVYSSISDFQNQNLSGPQRVKLAAEAEATWASHLIRMTCGAGMTYPSGAKTKVNVDFKVMPPPPPVYGVTAKPPPSWLLAPH